jgi:phage terminase large subunit-like protein
MPSGSKPQPKHQHVPGFGVAPARELVAPGPIVVTTTPKPIKIIRELIADPTTVITRGSIYDQPR